MQSPEQLLAGYHVRAQPLGIALFHTALASPLAHGQPAHFAFRALGSFHGFTQSHREEAGVSVFGAVLEGGYALVAQHPYQPFDAVSSSAWLRFVRLATAMTLLLAGRWSPPPEPPTALSSVLRPLLPTSPAPLKAEAPLLSDPEAPA